MTAADAMRQYVALVTSLSPQWKGSDLPPPGEDLGGEGAGGGGGGGGGRAVSTLMNNAEVIPDEKKTIFDWCKEGHTEKLSAMLTKTNINSTDEQVCASNSGAALTMNLARVYETKSWNPLSV